VAIPTQLCPLSPAVVRVKVVENHSSEPYVERIVDFCTLPAFKK